MVSVRRKGLSENNSTVDVSKPVGRTTALPTTTLATKDIEVAMPDDGCTDYAEIARTIMPDRSEEWRMVLNTQKIKPKFDKNGRCAYQPVHEAQTRLIRDLKKNIDLARHQREVFLQRVKVMGQQLYSELSQLSNAKDACARSDVLRKSIAELEAQLGSIKQEASEAIQKAETVTAELAEKQAELKAKEDEVAENRAMLDEATRASATAHQDCESERTQLSEQLEASRVAAAQLKESMTELEAKISKSEKDTASAKAEHAKQLANFETSTAAAIEQRKELAEAATLAETEATKLQSLQESNEATLAAEQATLQDCRTTMMEHKSDADKTEEELAGQQREVGRVRDEVASLKQTQTSLTEEISSLHAQKDQLHAQNHRMSEVMSELQGQCTELSEEQSKLTELNGKLQANIADTRDKAKLANETAADSLKKYTEASSANAALSRQLADKEAEQAAAKAEETAQTEQRDKLIVENEELTKAHADFVAQKPVLLEKTESQTAELAELRTQYGAAAKEQMEQ
eukprot:COSAG02_NODE_3557_length_6565_cov_395.452830_3_plen_518_part_00